MYELIIQISKKWKNRYLPSMRPQENFIIFCMVRLYHFFILKFLFFYYQFSLLYCFVQCEDYSIFLVSASKKRILKVVMQNPSYGCKGFPEVGNLSVKKRFFILFASIHFGLSGFHTFQRLL